MVYGQRIAFWLQSQITWSGSKSFQDIVAIVLLFNFYMNEMTVCEFDIHSFNKYCFKDTVVSLGNILASK